MTPTPTKLVGSAPMQLAKTDVWKLVKGALIGLSGLVLPYLATYIHDIVVPGISNTPDIPLWLPTVLAVGSNLVLKLFTNTRKIEQSISTR